ncbi:MAG: helix-turn-helix domain-containing protein [Firmicutes bacterium]|nr:helix-turn-helix domain-containing protein [Bacillota bacterium]
MKINLPIIYDQIKNECNLLVKCSTYDLSINQVRFFHTDCKLQKECIYIISGEDFDLYYDKIYTFSFIINGIKNKIPKQNAIYYQNKVNKYELFDEIQDVFIQFENWNQQVQKEIVKHKNIVSLSNEIGLMLQNPIALFDLSFRLIGTAGSIPSKEKLNREWLDIVEHGLAPVDSYNIPDQDIYFFAKHKKEIYIPAGNPYGNTDLFANIYVNHELFGIVAITNLIQEISDGEKAVLSIVRDYYELYFSLSFKEKNNYNVIHYYLQQLLDNKSIPFEALEYHLHKANWDTNTIYKLACLCHISDEYINQAQIEYAYSRILRRCKDNICFIFQNNIVILYDSNEYSLHSLKEEIIKLNLCCGISFVYNDIMDIRIAYQQALVSIEYGRKYKKEDILWDFEMTYAHTLKHALADKKDFLIHPMIKTLSNYDALNNTNFIQILKTYILSGGNSKKTAELLYMHRNTLLYKLEKIESILNIKLSDLQETSREIILYSILLM